MNFHQGYDNTVSNYINFLTADKLMATFFFFCIKL